MRIHFLDSVHPILADKLSAAGHHCLQAQNFVEGDPPGTWHSADGAVVRSRSVTRELLSEAPGLKFVARVGSGLENIDMAYCRQRGIRVLNAPEGNRDGVGETCVMLLLALMKLLVPANAQVVGGAWPREAHRGTDLRGKTVGIIGYGHMGCAFADKLRGFGVRVLAYDKYRSGFDKAGVRECSLDQVMRESEVISIHLPLTAETHHYANAPFFARLENPVWFINTSRGAVVHTRALLDAIDAGRVIAAGLDVLEFERPDLGGLQADMEPETQHRLLRHPRVLITPHIAGVTHEGSYKMASILADKILQAFPDA